MSQQILQGPQQTEAEKQTYSAWAKEKYAEQYENWMPWIEDNFLKYFTKDNKASYATKEQLAKTKVTGVEQIDNLQDGVNNLAAGTVGQGGILQPIGDLASKEGANRFERQGKDEQGSYIPGVKNSQLPSMPNMPSMPSVPGFGSK